MAILVMKSLYNNLRFCDTDGVFLARVTMLLRINM